MSKKWTFKYSPHAQYQMFNRNISQSQVERTVLSPDSIQRDKDDPTVTIAIKEFTPGTFTKVWYRLINGEPEITTCLVITTRRERPEASKNTSNKKRKGKR